jgi:replicative superfamily II helicase
MREIEKHIDPVTMRLASSGASGSGADGKSLDLFKIVYISPMKALASEIVEKFGDRLRCFGAVVKELTGDMQLSRVEMEQTHVIVTTPEKWDVITRKNNSVADQLKLLIIDEIHLLNDERGPVLECLVARTLQHIERI